MTDSADAPSTNEHGERSSAGPLGTAISNAVVSLFADYLGRGPTRARTVFGHDLLAVVLQETLTKAERRLVAEGEAVSVIATRRTFQRVMRDDLVAAIERLTGRTVVAFLSDQQVEPDYAVETFVLEPLVGDHDGNRAFDGPAVSE